MSKVAVKCAPKESINWSKTSTDLEFIKSFQVFTKSQGWRIVVSGGYGLDILLGQITRTHNDVDIIIYGQDHREVILPKITNFLSSSIQRATLEITKNDFMVVIDLHSPGLGANIYYVQTSENPFTNLNKIIKQNGEAITNTEKRFPGPVEGLLGDIHIDVQNPHTHLADILFKQRTLTHKPTHDQDIANLRQITDTARVDEILSLS